MNELEQVQRIHVTSAAALITSVFYVTGFGFGPILLVVCALFGGIFSAKWIFECSNGEMLFQWRNFVPANLYREDSSKNKPDDDDPKMDPDKTRRMPWEGLCLPAPLNESIENLLNEVVENYVNGWYGGAISRDRAFINEIRYQLRYASANLVRCIRRVDVSRFVANDALPNASFHLSRLLQIEQQCLSNIEITSVPPRSLLESRICEKLDNCHVALTGRESETEYVRQIADFLIPRLLDETRLAGRAHDDDSPLRLFGRGRNERSWPSKSVRGFLRELLTNAILLPIFDLLTQPDTINYWLVLLFDMDRKWQDVTAEYVYTSSTPLLRGLSDDTSSSENLPDSLLQLKLTEILRDARLYSIFRMFLQDVRGPVHELQFLVEATRILDSTQRKSETTSQIAYDIWQLYGQFVHESAQDRVSLDEHLVEQYKTAVEINCLEVLEGIVECSYQVLYNQMQSTHVISFCQSECFLGYLCGSPPITINELIDQQEQLKSEVPVDRTFSLSQLRARVRKALTSFAEEDGMGVETPESQESTVSTASSYVNIPVPSIEVIDINGSLEENLETNSVEQQLPSTSGLIMDPEPTDLNCWKVNVSQVSGLRDRVSDRIVFVFIIEVERPDAKSHETARWSIHRSFNEFYVLESKLNEFHGDALRFSPLPTRRTFVTKDKPFMEQHRLIFSAFLSTLSKQRLLNRSELLLSFLSSNEEFREALTLGDLNPWKVVRKMPGKLGREKGQNLKPYLLKTLAQTLAPSNRVLKERSMKETPTTNSDDITCLATNAIYSSVYGNNFEGIAYEKSMEEKNSMDKTIWSSSPYDACLLLFWNPLKYYLRWAPPILTAIRSLCKLTVDSVIFSIFGMEFKKALSVDRLTYLVQHIQFSLFCNEEPWPTEQEKKMREELAMRRTQEYFQNIAQRIIGRDDSKKLVSRVISALQYPRLNKQLLYVLVDRLLLSVFPELDESGHHPLQ